MAHLAQASDGLGPAERFLDPLSDPHRDGIAGMAGRAPVDRRTAVGVGPCNVGGAGPPPQFPPAIFCILVLVAPQRGQPGALPVPRDAPPPPHPPPPARHPPP